MQNEYLKKWILKCKHVILHYKMIYLGLRNSVNVITTNGYFKFTDHVITIGKLSFCKIWKSLDLQISDTANLPDLQYLPLFHHWLPWVPCISVYSTYHYAIIGFLEFPVSLYERSPVFLPLIGKTHKSLGTGINQSLKQNNKISKL